ncbi:hypothetical protein CLOBL_52170 [Clostridium sp. BL-8]|nr:hypothetical protein CLOBL_52170 [Clostridium sp. BL-8]
MIIFALPLLIPVLFIFMFFGMPFIVNDKCSEWIKLYPKYKIFINLLRVLLIITTTFPILTFVLWSLPYIVNSLTILNF